MAGGSLITAVWDKISKCRFLPKPPSIKDEPSPRTVRYASNSTIYMRHGIIVAGLQIPITEVSHICTTDIITS